MVVEGRSKGSQLQGMDGHDKNSAREKSQTQCIEMSSRNIRSPKVYRGWALYSHSAGSTKKVIISAHLIKRAIITLEWPAVCCAVTWTLLTMCDMVTWQQISHLLHFTGSACAWNVCTLLKLDCQYLTKPRSSVVTIQTPLWLHTMLRTGQSWP